MERNDEELLLTLLSRTLKKVLQSDEYDDPVFCLAKPTLKEQIERLLNNFFSNRQEQNFSNVHRLLKCHHWNGSRFDDIFGIKDLLDDIELFTKENMLFLHYELSEKMVKIEKGERLPIPESWLIKGNFQDLDVLFSVYRINSLTHHVTKVYYSVGEDGKSFSFKGKRIFPSRDVTSMKEETKIVDEQFFGR
jgi:hypothetical protein